MKTSEMNATQKKAFFNIKWAANDLLGGLENTMEDNPEDSREYQNAKAMLAAHDAGAVIMPASPPLYTHPQTIADLTDLIAARVLDHCGVSHTIGSRWKE